MALNDMTALLANQIIRVLGMRGTYLASTTAGEVHEQTLQPCAQEKQDHHQGSPLSTMHLGSPRRRHRSEVKAFSPPRVHSQRLPAPSGGNEGQEL